MKLGHVCQLKKELCSSFKDEDDKKSWVKTNEREKPVFEVEEEEIKESLKKYQISFKEKLFKKKIMFFPLKYKLIFL